jgi:CTP-dependent riboflavin kinase
MIRSIDFKLKHKIKSSDFTRKVKLTFSIMVGIMIKKSSKSSQNSLNDMFLNDNISHTVTNSAYTQARAKLNYTAFVDMSNTITSMFYSDGEYNKYKNFRLLSIDGSIVILPNTNDVKKEFNPTPVRCQVDAYEKDVVQSRMSVLYDVLNNMALDATIKNKVNSDKNDLIAYDERTLALQHLEYCNKDDLVLFDRGYPSYELFVKYAQKTNFVCRIKKTSFSKAKFLFAAHSEKKDDILEITAPKNIKEDLKLQNLSTKMKIRFVQVILNNGTVEVLATNILDNNILQTNDFMELYSKRWGIETYFDILKNRLSLENFTGLTALAVKQDFYATVFLTNYEAMLVYDTNLELEERSIDNQYSKQVNKAQSFNAIKHKAFDIFYSNKSLEKQIQKLEQLFVINPVPIRKNRKTKPRLDKDAQKSTIANNSINHMKRKKKNIGN